MPPQAPASVLSPVQLHRPSSVTEETAVCISIADDVMSAGSGLRGEEDDEDDVINMVVQGMNGGGENLNILEYCTLNSKATHTRCYIAQNCSYNLKSFNVLSFGHLGAKKHHITLAS